MYECSISLVSISFENYYFILHFMTVCLCVCVRVFYDGWICWQRLFQRPKLFVQLKNGMT